VRYQILKALLIISLILSGMLLAKIDNNKSRKHDTITFKKAGGMSTKEQESTISQKGPLPKPLAGEDILFLGNLNFNFDDNATLFRDFLDSQGYNRITVT